MFVSACGWHRNRKASYFVFVPSCFHFTLHSAWNCSAGVTKCQTALIRTEGRRGSGQTKNAPNSLEQAEEHHFGKFCLPTSHDSVVSKLEARLQHVAFTAASIARYFGMLQRPVWEFGVYTPNFACSHCFVNGLKWGNCFVRLSQSLHWSTKWSHLSAQRLLHVVGTPLLQSSG